MNLGEIVDKLKDVLSETVMGKKVFDKDVALALNIPQGTFASMKKRNSIPYEEILEFCALKKISVNWLFFDQAVDMLKERRKSFFKYVTSLSYVLLLEVVQMSLMKIMKILVLMKRLCITW